MRQATQWGLAGLAAMVLFPEPVEACGCYYPSVLELAYWFVGGGLWLTTCLLATVGLGARLARLKPAPLWPSRCLSLALVFCAAQVPLAVLFYALLLAGLGFDSYPGDPYFSLFANALVLLSFLVWVVRYWRGHVLRHPAMAAALAAPLRAVPVLVAFASGLAVMAENVLRWRWLEAVSPEPIFVASMLGSPLLALVAVAWNHWSARREARRAIGPDACAVGGPLLLNSAEAICRICGSEIGSEAVTCERCLAPHHTDCWRYAGRCATYGCGGTQRLN